MKGYVKMLRLFSRRIRKLEKKLKEEQHKKQGWKMMVDFKNEELDKKNEELKSRNKEYVDLMDKTVRLFKYVDERRSKEE